MQKQIKQQQVSVEEAGPHPSSGRQAHTCLMPLAVQRRPKKKKPNVLKLTYHQDEKDPPMQIYTLQPRDHALIPEDVWVPSSHSFGCLY